MNNREAFEAWANTHGGLDLTVHEAMDNEKLSFPCTYYSYITEIAWRAFANKKEPAQADLASQEQQPEITTKDINAEFLKECADENGHCVLKNDVTFALGYKCGYQACLASQAQQESLWQPIATAPKNTKIIVRYKNICGKDRTVFAKYLDKFTEEATKGTDCETDYCEDDDTFYCKEGWVELIDNWDEFSSVYFDSSNVPTHWMPLPPAGE